MRFDVDVFCLDLSQDVALLCFAFTGCLGGQMHVEESAASIKFGGRPATRLGEPHHEGYKSVNYGTLSKLDFQKPMYL